MVTIGLWMGVPLRGQGRPAAGQARSAVSPHSSSRPDDGSDKNFLNWLVIANANVEAAAKNRMPNATKMPTEITGKLRDVKTQINESREGWTRSGGKGSTISSSPPPATLLEQLEDAKIALANAAKLAEKPPAPEDVRAPLKEAAEELASVQKLVLEGKNISKGDGQHTEETSPADEAKSDAAILPGAAGQAGGRGDGAVSGSHGEPEIKEQQEGKKQAEEEQGAKQLAAERQELAISSVALVLTTIAFVVLFLTARAAKKLRSRSVRLEADLQQAKLHQKQLQTDLGDLGNELASLKLLVQSSFDRPNRVVDRSDRGADGSQPRPAPVGDVSLYADAREDGIAQGMKGAQPQAGTGESAGGVAGTLPTVRIKETPKPRNPVADYNEARAKRAAERAAEFGNLYPRQMLMACLNPAARNSGPFTDLRFKEDEYGNFLAVLDGKQMLVFPSLTYDYSTGRKTLEGVFEYPEGESTTLQLWRSGTLEKRGDEWVLTEQGAFRNG